MPLSEPRRFRRLLLRAILEPYQDAEHRLPQAVDELEAARVRQVRAHAERDRALLVRAGEVRRPRPWAVRCGWRRPRASSANGDRMRVEQVVPSLLSNALESGARQLVEVRVESDGKVARVEDRGIGIPEDQLERIFERFGRAVSSRSYGGLGLYLSRRAAEAHGGRVWAEQRQGGGARFTMELPLNPVPPQSPKEPA